jgi:hypothetical protein
MSESDVDLFADDLQKKSYFRQKQERFEQRVLLKLLRAVEPVAGAAKSISRDAGDEFGLLWLMRIFPHFPINLITLKARSTVALTDLVKWPERTAVYKELERACDDYSGEDYVGIIFGSDGDGMQDMVLHDAILWSRSDKYWRVLLPGGKYILDSLDGFIDAFKENTDWRLEDPSSL